MDEFLYVRTLRGAIYGKVALVQHRQSGKLYAVKMMSLAHMSARQAISGPAVCEDGDAELRVLRKLSGNRVFGSDSESEDGGLPVSESSWSVHPEWESLKLSYQQPQPHHHNILMLHKDFVDESSNARCLVFDYCPYGELYDQVGAPSSDSNSSSTSKAALACGLEAARGFFRQIARAVRFIHAHNIAHRDISLENVLLDEFQHCRLGDFGLASEHGAMCLGRVGKTFYMAPEVLVCREDEFYDGLKADMWSLGVLLFILVTGAPPFEMPAESDARFRVVKHQGVGQLLCIWQMENRVSDELRDLMTQMLCVNVRERISIDHVCSHPWLRESVGNGFEAREDELEYPEHLTKTQDYGYATKQGAVSEPEPHDDGTMEKNEPLNDSYTGALKTTGKSQRTRKRIKISIVPDSAFQYVAAAPASSRVDTGAFGGARASNAPALAHENSPWGHEAPSGSLFAPHTTPTAGPRAQSGGRKVTLRSLRFHSVDGPSGSQMDSDAEDEEDKFAASTRRRRTSLSVSCSSMLLTKSLKVEEESECPPKCRFCWSELVEEEDTIVDNNLTRTLSGGRGSSSMLCVCESCFYATPAPLTLTTGGAATRDATHASVLVLRKAGSRTRPAQVV